MGDLIDFKSLGYASYEDFLNDKDNNSEACADISEEVFVDVTSLIKKKS
jgi:hypothetical protein